jgi:hypothetical protein
MRYNESMVDAGRNDAGVKYLYVYVKGRRRRMEFISRRMS